MAAWKAKGKRVAQASTLGSTTGGPVTQASTSFAHPTHMRTHTQTYTHAHTDPGPTRASERAVQQLWGRRGLTHQPTTALGLRSLIFKCVDSQEEFPL